jgi:hypothetical protein
VKKFIGYGLVFGLLIVFGLISARILSGGSKSAAIPGPAATATPSTGPGSLPPPSTGGEQDSGSQTVSHKRTQRAAVQSAAAAVEQVSVAQFLPRDTLRLTLKQTVVPELHRRYEQQYREAGNQLALLWGWQTSEQALANAQYRVTSQMCRVDRYNGKRATIMLYTLSHWLVKVPDQSDGATRVVPFNTPLISAVRMRWEQGRWLYVSSRDALVGPLPSGEQPEQEPNLSTPEAERRFQPYLQKGYKPCNA